VLFRVALRRLRNIEDAEDTVQDALLSAHNSIGKFQGRSKLSTWLIRIVTNAALMKLRRHSRYEMLPLGQYDANEGATSVSELIDPGPNPEAIYAQTEMGETLRRALAQLPAKQRTAIQLYELDGISIREASNALGVSENTLKSQVARARESLNLILGEVITTRHATEAATGGNWKSTVCRYRCSAVHRGASTANAGLTEHRSRHCISSCVPVSYHDEILNHTEMHAERADIHYPPHSLEIAAPHKTPSYAT
jgi:RNA polymerase sigma-70 factor (ECF subfamily)